MHHTLSDVIEHRKQEAIKIGTEILKGMGLFSKMVDYPREPSITEMHRELQVLHLHPR